VLQTRSQRPARNGVRGVGDTSAVEDIPDFDDLKVALLKLVSAPFGVAGRIIVGVYVIWGVVTSYVRATKSGIRFSGAVRDWFVWQHQRQSGELWYAIGTTVLMLAM
jgi:hypothetical protein